ncbi:E3 ubiquitin-protein ligase RNF130, partial [Tolypocladium paradoxum]
MREDPHSVDGGDDSAYIQQIQSWGNFTRWFATSQTENIQSPVRSENDKSVDICCICTESFELEDRVRLLPCKHKFHQACIDPWLSEKSVLCPL